MSVNQQEDKWFSQIMSYCFLPGENIAEVSFMIIFASWACAPCNRNYGKKKDERYKGAAKADSRRQPEIIRKDQQKLLNQFSCFLDNWSSDGESIKLRIVDLTDALKNNFLDSEREYIKKSSNYKPNHYLSFCLDVPEAKAREDFERMCIFYGNAFEKIFSSEKMLLEGRCEELKEVILRDIPQYEETESDDIAKVMGRYLAIAMMCAAGQDGINCACRILGIEPPETEATLSVFSLDQVELKTAQFNRICTAALRADMETVELQAVQDVLEWIWNKTYGNPDCDTRILVEKLKTVAAKCLERLLDSMKEDRPAAESSALLQEIETVIRIRSKCQEWLS